MENQNDLENKIKQVCEELGLECNKRQTKDGQEFLLFRKGLVYYAVGLDLFKDSYDSIKKVMKRYYKLKSGYGGIYKE